MTDTNLNEESGQDSEPADSVNSEQELLPSPGQFLKKLREELGFSREDVSKSLYITVHYVKALEKDNYSKLPGHTFIKGYYKAYADFLGADTEQVLDCYIKYLEKSSNSELQESQTAEAVSRNKTIVWGIIVIVLIIAVAGGFWMMSDASAQSMPAAPEEIND